MSDYKLVLVEPTEAMLRSAMQYDAVQDPADPNSNAEALRTDWRLMLAEAPVIDIVATKNEQGQIVSVTLQDEDHHILEVIAEADVQGEPVEFCEDAALSLAERTFSSEVDEQLAEDVIQYARRLHALYTAPRLSQDVQELAASLYQACGAYDMPERILDALSAAANGEPFSHMIDGLLPCTPPTDQDVGALVEALTELCDEIDNHKIEIAISKTNILRFKRKARSALAAYRRQEGDV